MAVIWKFDVPPWHVPFPIDMPKGAQILTAQNQNESAVFWALIPDINSEHETRYFKAYGTGHEIKDDKLNKKYIGTFQIEGGLVFHLFEVFGV